MNAKKFGMILSLFMNIIMGSVLTLIAFKVGGVPFSAVLFGQYVLISLGLGYVLSDWIPAYAIGQMLASKMGIKNNFLIHAVAVAVLDGIFVTLCSFLNSFAAFGADLFQPWLGCLPFYLGSGYIVLLIVLPIGMKLATAISGFDPVAAA